MGQVEYQASNKQEFNRSQAISDTESLASIGSQPYINLHSLNLHSLKKGEPVDGKVDWKGRQAIKGKHGGLFSSLLVLATFGFQNMAVFAFALNLVTYLSSVMHFSIADASNSVSNFLGTGYILSFFVAYFADSYIGRCKTVGMSICIVLLGFVLVTFQAHFPNLKPPPCNIYAKTTKCEKVGGGNAGILYIAQYLIAIGISGVRSSMPSHGADQFYRKDPKEAKQMSSFFNWILLSESIGGIISLIFIVWIQTNIGWDWGFGASTLAMIISVTVFFTGVPRYRIHVNQRTNDMIEIIQVYVASFRNRKLDLPQDPEELYEMDRDQESAKELEFLPHGDTFRFLDKAAIQTWDPPSPWKLSRVTQVEKAKIILGIIPIFCCTIFMSTGQAQLATFSIHQGLTMDSRLVGSIKIPPASLPIIPFFFLIFLVPAYDRIFVPFAGKITKLPTGITYLQRIGVGLLLSSVAMASAALMEVKRKQTAKQYNMIDAVPTVEPLPISIFWLSFQYFIYGICDLFTNVGLLEFFYAEAPNALKSISTSFLWLSIGIGYFLSSLLVELVNEVTRRITKKQGWLEGNNLNRQHLESFYCLISAVSFINFLHFLFWARRYKYRSLISSRVNFSKE